jgi:hypothetical protein
MRLPRRSRQSGQALLLVLVFVAAFLLLTWAALSLASGAFLTLSAVQSDTRETYALDAGVAAAIEYIDLKKGLGCNRPQVPTFSLPYPTAISVTTTITKTKSCGGLSGVWDISVSATGTNRTLTAEIAQTNGNWTITAESYQ